MGTYHPSADEAAPLLVEAQRALRLTQETLGELLGLSRRTVWRFQSGKSGPLDTDLHKLARLIHPSDRGLAKRLAAAGGQTLESLGIEVVAPPPPPVAAPPVDARTARLFADAIVCTAAEALDAPPRVVRVALHAAFLRAVDTGLGLKEVATALAPKARAKPARPGRGRA